MPGPIFTKALFLGNQPVVLVDQYGNPIITTNPIAVQVADDQSDVSRQILAELRAIRLALTHLACEGKTAKPEDFDPLAFADDLQPRM